MRGAEWRGVRRREVDRRLRDPLRPFAERDVDEVLEIPVAREERRIEILVAQRRIAVRRRRRREHHGPRVAQLVVVGRLGDVAGGHHAPRVDDEHEQRHVPVLAARADVFGQLRKHVGCERALVDGQDRDREPGAVRVAQRAPVAARLRSALIDVAAIAALRAREPYLERARVARERDERERRDESESTQSGASRRHSMAAVVTSPRRRPRRAGSSSASRRENRGRRRRPARDDSGRGRGSDRRRARTCRRRPCRSRPRRTP